MFDILTVPAVPDAVKLSAELANARDASRADFRKLAPSPERDSVLGALGRLGRPSLKQKVRYRAEIVQKTMPRQLPGLIGVVDQAVNCRNYFVHGGEPAFNYVENENLLWFFTDTLEFLFATSDLVEAGWEPSAWLARTSTSHPFSNYLREYARNERTLGEVLEIRKGSVSVESPDSA